MSDYTTKLKTDFIKIIEACVNDNLENIDIDWYDDKSLCIVLCSKATPINTKTILK